MKIAGVLIAGALLAFVLSDIWYIAQEWAEFRPHDVARHVQYQAISIIAIAWYLWLVARAWQMNGRTHAKLALAFIILVALTVTYFLLWPVFEHASYMEGISVFYGLAFMGVLLLLGIATVWWSWRVSMPNPSFKWDCRKSAAAP